MVRMDESADFRKVVMAVTQSDWKRPTGRPHLLAGRYEERPIISQPSVEDATELALDRPLWGLLAASGGTH